MGNKTKRRDRLSPEIYVVFFLLGILFLALSGGILGSFGFQLSFFVVFVFFSPK
jgi:hypothetical protein